MYKVNRQDKTRQELELRAGPGGSGSMSHPWQKTEPVGVKTDGLAKSEAYGNMTWQAEDAAT